MATESSIELIAGQWYASSRYRFNTVAGPFASLDEANEWFDENASHYESSFVWQNEKADTDTIVPGLN